MWTGHPARLTKAIIEKHLKGASKYLTFGWPEPFEGVAKSVARDEYSKAFGEIDKVATAEGADRVRAEVTKMLGTRIDSMNKALELGDYYAANEVAQTLDGQLKGLPEADKVSEVLTRLKTDAEAKGVLKAQEALQKLMSSDLNKKKKVQAAISKAEKILNKNDGNIAGTQAAEFIEKMRTRLLGL